MANTQQNYSYANTSDGRLVNVSSAQRDSEYYCPICGTRMTPHMGKVRRWHFVHKNSDKCSYETYLHSIAKFRIKEAFQSSEPFYITYNATAVCCLTCPYLGFPKCTGEKNVKFDLRKFYDTCELEATYNNFRADILLTSSTHPNRPPILIEIKVTHECTQEKISDGVRIIEIPISCEEQIEDIIKNRVFEGVRNGQYSYWERRSHKGYEPIMLYNFNKIEDYDPSESADDYDDTFHRKATLVFCLDRNGRFRNFDCHCYEVANKVPHDVHYFVTNIATPFKEIFQEFSKRGVKIRNCFLCKFSKKDYYDERICVLYKKYNLPRKPSPSMALDCSHYCEDFTPPVDANSQISEVEQDPNTGYKTHYHICKDIL